MGGERPDLNTQILYTSENDVDYLLSEFNRGNISIFVQYNPVLNRLNIEFPEEGRYRVLVRVYEVQDGHFVLVIQWVNSYIDQGSKVTRADNQGDQVNQVTRVIRGNRVTRAKE